MINVETVPKLESLLAELRELSEEEQRALAGAVLQDRKLEAFVEELEDHLRCESAAAEGSLELLLLKLNLTIHKDLKGQLLTWLLTTLSSRSRRPAANCGSYRTRRIPRRKT